MSVAASSALSATAAGRGWAWTAATESGAGVAIVGHVLSRSWGERVLPADQRTIRLRGHPAYGGIVDRRNPACRPALRAAGPHDRAAPILAGRRVPAQPGVCRDPRPDPHRARHGDRVGGSAGSGHRTR